MVGMSSFCAESCSAAQTADAGISRRIAVELFTDALVVTETRLRTKAVAAENSLIEFFISFLWLSEFRAAALSVSSGCCFVQDAALFGTIALFKMLCSARLLCSGCCFVQHDCFVQRAASERRFLVFAVDRPQR